MGRRYSKEELGLIQSLVAEGRTNREIASHLGRPEAGIRNLRHRLKLLANTRETIQSLQHEKEALRKNIADLKRIHTHLTSGIVTLQTKKENLNQALSLDTQELNARLIPVLTKLKDQKPELFYITGAEQIGKIARELANIFLKWLIS